MSKEFSIVTLELLTGSDPIRGRLLDSTGSPRQFTGWAELAHAISSAIETCSVPVGSQTPTGPPQPSAHAITPPIPDPTPETAS